MRRSGVNWCDTNRASSQSWKACRSATWSLQRVPARLLCTQSSRRRSIGVTNGSENVVLAAIVHMASPQLYQTHTHVMDSVLLHSRSQESMEEVENHSYDLYYITYLYSNMYHQNSVFQLFTQHQELMAKPSFMTATWPDQAPNS